MTGELLETQDVKVYPATAERWGDLELLFGPRSAYSGCWCMFWRLRRSDFNNLQGEGRKAVLKDLTMNNEVPGVLAYLDGLPIGWCSIGPRQDFAALENSRILKRVDDVPVWSIVCFFVAKPYRKNGIMSKLLHGAVDYAVQHGARVVEGYPIDMTAHKLVGQTLTGYSGFMGIASAFEEAGFIKSGEASETQLIMRYFVDGIG